jgi:hypothetical protein
MLDKWNSYHDCVSLFLSYQYAQHNTYCEEEFFHISVFGIRVGEVILLMCLKILEEYLELFVVKII